MSSLVWFNAVPLKVAHCKNLSATLSGGPAVHTVQYWPRIYLKRVPNLKHVPTDLILLTLLTCFCFTLTGQSEFN